MYDNFMSVEILGTFAGIVAATSIIVQFTKSIIKKNFGDGLVRIYTFVIALILNFAFAKSGSGIQGIILTIINGLMVTLAAMGSYEAFSDPMAQKQRANNKLGNRG